jgi:hypothetical protein
MLMSRTSKALLAEAMQLPPSSRAAIAEKLLMSVYDEQRIKRIARKAETVAEQEKAKDIPLDDAMTKLSVRMGSERPL